MEPAPEAAIEAKPWPRAFATILSNLHRLQLPFDLASPAWADLGGRQSGFCHMRTSVAAPAVARSRPVQLARAKV
jgi:hypothetical protein